MLFHKFCIIFLPRLIFRHSLYTIYHNRKEGSMQTIPESIQTHDHDRQNLLLKQYLNKYFSPNKIEELVGEFSFSELRKLLGEMDLEFFSLCYFPKYLSLIHISEPTRLGMISYAVFCLKKKNKKHNFYFLFFFFFFLMIRRPPRSTLSSSSAASDVYKRQWRDGFRIF